MGNQSYSKLLEECTMTEQDADLNAKATWLNRTVWGMAITSFLSDLGHEAQSTLLPGFMAALGLPPMARGAVEGLAEQLACKPAVAAYRAALRDMAGLSKRWKLHTAVTLMPDDPDGVWSEACDGYGDNVSADLDDVVELCRLYQAIERTPVTA